MTAVAAGSAIDEPRLSARAWSLLNDIIDPCSIQAGAPAGLVDLGLVRSVSFTPTAEGGWGVEVTITITHPFCMMAGVFINEIRKRLIQIDGIDAVEATLDSSTMWTPQLMTPAYRERLDRT